MNPIPEQLFVLQNQEQVGPFPSETVRQMLELGGISAADLVWAEGMPEWVTAESLFGVTASPEPAPATPVNRRSTGTRPKAESFGRFIGDAMSYPFRGFGWVTLLAGTIVLTGISWFNMLPAAPGLLGLFLGLVSWGYLLLMLQSVIQRTAFGKSDLPEWPDFDGFGELLGKCFQWFVTLVVCFGPALYLLGRFAGEDGDGLGLGNGSIVITALIVGAVYFPMAILGVAMFDTLGAINPLLVVRSIKQVPGHYALTLVIFGLLLGLKAVTVNFSDLIPVLGTMLDHFDSLWSSIFLARVLGGLYAINREKLGWF